MYGQQGHKCGHKPRKASRHQKLEKAGNRFSPGALRRNMPLDFRLLASGAGRGYVPVVRICSECAYSSPMQRMHSVNVEP